MVFLAKKILKVVGCSFDESEVAWLKERAHYEKERMYSATLFDPIEDNNFQEIDNDCIQIVGPELIIGKWLLLAISQKIIFKIMIFH